MHSSLRRASILLVFNRRIALGVAAYAHAVRASSYLTLHDTRLWCRQKEVLFTSPQLIFLDCTFYDLIIGGMIYLPHYIDDVRMSCVASLLHVCLLIPPIGGTFGIIVKTNDSVLILRCLSIVIIYLAHALRIILYKFTLHILQYVIYTYLA